MKKKRILFLFLLIMTMLLAGCGEKKEKPEKIKDLDYTVQEESEVPEELLQKMKEKQKEPFQMTYETEEYLYIAKGYGTQKNSGYSIRVLELYESPEGIVFLSELIGPAKDEPVLQVEMYPSIVIKLENYGLNVIFE